MNEENPVLPNNDDALIGTVKQLQEEVKQLRGEIEHLKTQIKPDALAKILDSSYLSINNLRAFLQILSVILTIFLGGAVAFGYVGLTNISSIREEADKVRSTRKSVDHVAGSIFATEQDIKLRIDSLQRSFQETNEAIQHESKKAIDALRTQLENQLEANEKKIAQVNVKLREISEIFNKVAIQRENDLSAREMHLLFLLAQEIDHEDLAFNFNAASTAFRFKKYEDALQILEKVLEHRAVPADIRRRAETMRSEAQRFMDSPREARDWDFETMIAISNRELDMGLLQAHLFGFLRRQGYISDAEAQTIINDSRIKRKQ